MTSDLRHTFTIREGLAEIIYETIRDRIAAHHNWIASSIERDDIGHAKQLTINLRQLEIIAATFNVEGKKMTRPGVTTHEEHVPLF